jgi:hypothetical protein
MCLIWLGIGVELALLLGIVYTPLGNRLFGGAPIAPSVWLLALPFGALMLALDQGRKMLARRKASFFP